MLLCFWSFPACFPKFIIFLVESEIFSECENLAIANPMSFITSSIDQKECVLCFYKQVSLGFPDAKLFEWNIRKRYGSCLQRIIGIKECEKCISSFLAKNQKIRTNPFYMTNGIKWSSDSISVSCESDE